MIGGPIGLGIGAPHVLSTTAVQSGGFDADGAALVDWTGQSTVAASSVITGSTATGLAGSSIVHVAFGLSGAATLFAEGRSRVHVAFDVSATSGFDFQNVPLLAGSGTIQGSANSNFTGGFSVLPTKDTIPHIDTGQGQASFAAGQALTSASAGKGYETIEGGRGKQAAVSGFAQSSIR